MFRQKIVKDVQNYFHQQVGLIFAFRQKLDSSLILSLGIKLHLAVTFRVGSYISFSREKVRKSTLLNIIHVSELAHIR
jgi:hypothetical protein